MHFDVIKR